MEINETPSALKLNAIEERIKQWKINALVNAQNANDACAGHIENGWPTLARISNNNAIRYVAQVDAYEEVLALIRDSR